MVTRSKTDVLEAYNFWPRFIRYHCAKKDMPRIFAELRCLKLRVLRVANLLHVNPLTTKSIFVIASQILVSLLSSLAARVKQRFDPEQIFQRYSKTPFHRKQNRAFSKLFNTDEYLQ